MLLTATGIAEVTDFLNSGKAIKAGVRALIRQDPTYIPMAATCSRELALHILETDEGNIFCLHHHFRDKANHVRDGWGKPGVTCDNPRHSCETKGKQLMSRC